MNLSDIRDSMIRSSKRQARQNAVPFVPSMPMAQRMGMVTQQPQQSFGTGFGQDGMLQRGQVAGVTHEGEGIVPADLMQAIGGDQGLQRLILQGLQSKQDMGQMRGFQTGTVGIPIAGSAGKTPYSMSDATPQTPTMDSMYRAVTQEGARSAAQNVLTPTSAGGGTLLPSPNPLTPAQKSAQNYQIRTGLPAPTNTAGSSSLGSAGIRIPGSAGTTPYTAPGAIPQGSAILTPAQLSAQRYAPIAAALGTTLPANTAGSSSLGAAKPYVAPTQPAATPTPTPATDWKGMGIRTLQDIMRGQSYAQDIAGNQARMKLAGANAADQAAAGITASQQGVTGGALATEQAMLGREQRGAMAGLESELAETRAKTAETAAGQVAGLEMQGAQFEEGVRQADRKFEEDVRQFGVTTAENNRRWGIENARVEQEIKDGKTSTDFNALWGQYTAALELAGTTGDYTQARSIWNQLSGNAAFKQWMPTVAPDFDSLSKAVRTPILTSNIANAVSQNPNNFEEGYTAARADIDEYLSLIDPNWSKYTADQKAAKTRAYYQTKLNEFNTDPASANQAKIASFYSDAAKYWGVKIDTPAEQEALDNWVGRGMASSDLYVDTDGTIKAKGTFQTMPWDDPALEGTFVSDWAAKGERGWNPTRATMRQDFLTMHSGEANIPTAEKWLDAFETAAASGLTGTALTTAIDKALGMTGAKTGSWATNDDGTWKSGEALTTGFFTQFGITGEDKNATLFETYLKEKYPNEPNLALRLQNDGANVAANYKTWATAQTKPGSPSNPIVYNTASADYASYLSPSSLGQTVEFAVNTKDTGLGIPIPAGKYRVEPMTVYYSAMERNIPLSIYAYVSDTVPPVRYLAKKLYPQTGFVANETVLNNAIYAALKKADEAGVPQNNPTPENTSGLGGG